MKVQYIQTMEGADLAILPADDYKAMAQRLEDIGDEIDAAEAMAAIEAGEETLPDEMVKRMSIGRENPLRVWREYRGMTQPELAEKAGVSQGHISELEKTGKAPTLDMARRIADAMNCDIDDLF